ncbi:DUF1456 family protein (plasmid) [Erwinia amylovora]|nr:DUF1456 family protein [Erwinia amylovora]
MSEYLTANFKLLSSALKLSRYDVAEIIGLGGITVSNTKADTWLRSPSATKNATGNSERVGERIKRASEINDDEFRAFCRGLRPWLDNMRDNG